MNHPLVDLDQKLAGPEITRRPEFRMTCSASAASSDERLTEGHRPTTDTVENVRGERPPRKPLICCGA